MKQVFSKKLTSALALFLAIIFILPACSPSSDEPEIPSYSASLPELRIDAENGKEITSKTEYSDITLKLTLSEDFAEYTNSYTDEDGGKAELRCRGNSTYGKPDMKAKNKYSYKLHLDEKADLLGLGASRHWYLLANWFDVTHMRNKLAYDLSGELGLTYTKSTWVNLYYNGEYRGIYSLVESIRIEDGRIDTFNWEEYAEDICNIFCVKNNVPDYVVGQLEEAMKNDLSWLSTQKFTFTYTVPDTYEVKTVHIDFSDCFDPNDLDFTSGYLIEYDNRLHGESTKWRTKHNIPVVMDNPAALSTNSYMHEYVQTLIQDFENALYSPTFYNEKGYHYSHYLDVDSLVSYWTVWNLFNNIEFGVLSLYYYIDDGKIVFGPCWDFDNATGNIVTLKEKWERWDYWVEDRGNNGNGWFSQIMGDPYFVALCQEKWFGMQDLVKNMLASLDVYHEYIGADAVKCYERNGPRTNWYLKSRNGGVSYDFETDFNLLKSWLNNRVKWINENFSSSYARVDDSEFVREKKLFIKPEQNTLTAPSSNYKNGVTPDYLLTDSAQIYLNVSTTCTTARRVEIFFNGKRIYSSPIDTVSAIPLILKSSFFKKGKNAMNVIYVVAFKEDGSVRGMNSLVIKSE
ncbi:MAG: hypothetical protein E7626_03500 [Ruminococcaceae bacterium]|nr:hypothetical protein [Oscillospiraceae bacterium]